MTSWDMWWRKDGEGIMEEMVKKKKKRGGQGQLVEKQVITAGFYLASK